MDISDGVALHVSGLRFSYGNKVILRDINLRVRAGEAVVLFGRNGSGKSTLLKLAAGLLAPDSGSIYYSGFAIHSMKPHEVARLGIGYLMQGGIVFPNLTVGENLAIAQSRGRSARLQPISDDIHAAYPFLQELMKRRAGLLSGGERQALAFSMIFSQNPKVLLLDEPVAALSSNLSAATTHLIERLCIESGCLAVIAEHNFTLANRLRAICYLLDFQDGAASTLTPIVTKSEGGQSR